MVNVQSFQIGPLRTLTHDLVRFPQIHKLRQEIKHLHLVNNDFYGHLILSRHPQSDQFDVNVNKVVHEKANLNEISILIKSKDFTY